MKRMDKIGDSGQTYKKTGLTTIVILIALIQIYVSISAGDVLWQFLIIQNETLRAVVKGLLDCFVFSILYGILYFLVDLFYRTLWIYRNKRIFIQGKWLHIHKKDPIRIGVVDIKQEFENIYATAENIAPEGQQEKAYQVTSWKYMMATVHADSSTVRDVIGCYTATKKDSNISNDGMHMLNITAEEGYPVRMDGRSATPSGSRKQKSTRAIAAVSFLCSK